VNHFVAREGRVEWARGKGKRKGWEGRKSRGEKGNEGEGANSKMKVKT